MSSPQNWICGVKLGERFEGDEVGSVSTMADSTEMMDCSVGMTVGMDVDITATGCCATGAGETAMIGIGLIFIANDASTELITITVRGMTVKPDKQPLPDSYGDAAVCRMVSVERARGISILFSGSQGPVLENGLLTC